MSSPDTKKNTPDNSKVELATSDTPLIGGDKDKDNKPDRKVLSVSILLVLLILFSTSVFFVRKQQVIKIGDTTITKKDIDDYEKQLKHYEKVHPGSKFVQENEDLNIYARDRLIMHAALVKEAKDNNVTINNDDIKKIMGQEFSDKSQERSFFKELKSDGQRINYINLQNQAYQSKLFDRLIAKKDLTAVSIVLASPYFDKLPPNEIQGKYDAARDKLAKDYLPLINSNAQAIDIAKKADAAWNFPELNQQITDPNAYIAKQLGQYSSQPVVSVEAMKNYTSGSINFNNSNTKNWVKADVGKLYDPAEKIDSLNKPGENTGIFAAKNGGYMIIRLESLNGGKYSNWNNFLNHYKQKYAGDKINEITSLTKKNVGYGVNKSLDIISSIGIAKVKAQEPDSTCLNNKYTMTVQAYDIMSGALLAGAKLNAYRDPNSSFTRMDSGHVGEVYTPGNTCGSAGNNYMVSSASGYIKTNGTWGRYGDGNETDRTFHDSCWNVPPVWSVVGDPANYARVNNSQGNNASWGNSYYTGNQDYSMFFEAGFPNPPNADNVYHLIPGLANMRDYYVYLKYKPDWNITPNSTVSRTTAGRGQVVTFKHSLTPHGYPADYNWQVTMKYESNPGFNVSDGSGGHVGVMSGSERDVPDGVKRPNPNTIGKATGKDVWTIPSNAPLGTYCERIKFSNRYGPGGVNNLDYFSDGYTTACVEVVANPVTGGGGDNCTSYSVSRPPDYGTTAGNSTGTAPATARKFYKVYDGSDLKYSGSLDSDGSTLSWSTSLSPVHSTIRIVENTQYYSHTASPNGWYDEDSTGSAGYQAPKDVTYTCYAATCTIQSVTGSGKNDEVMAGDDITVTVRIVNTKLSDNLPLPENVRNGATTSHLSLTYSDPPGNGENDVGKDLDYGEFTDIEIPGKARSSVGTQTISEIYPDYYGTGRIGPNCPAFQFPVYQEFGITPHANLNGTINEENPTVIGYSTGATHNSGPNVAATVTSGLYKNGSQVDFPASSTRNYGTDPDETFSYNNPTITPGDRFCARVTVNPAYGYVGPSGNLYEEARSAESACIVVHNEPYVHFLGSDVSAGGGFKGGSCNNPGGIKTFTNNTTFTTNSGTLPSGAGVQIGALSIGPIEGFSSANYRGSFPTATAGLSFSNTTNTSPPNFGGNMGGTRCATDFYGTLSDTNTPVDTSGSAPATYPNGTDIGVKIVKNFVPTGGTLDINGLTISDNTRVALYVKGNVHIKGNIRFSNTNWSNIESIPSLYIMVEGGSIYIDPGVRQLDGVYVSQKDGAAGGNIYTCGNGVGQFPGTDLLSQCRNQLVINGAFVAEKVYLERSWGSLRNAQPGEKLQLTNRNCGDSGTTTLNDCAAEIFNYSPELYLAQPAVTPSGGPSTGKYDFITSLSPVL